MRAALARIGHKRGTWALSDPSSVLFWRLGIGWSVLAGLLDASTGKRVVLSALVLLGPCCVVLTGRWLRTAVAGAWAVFLVIILGIPDGIWGSGLQGKLIDLAVLVATGCTLALVITFRGALSLALTALLASCGSAAGSAGRRTSEPTVPVTSCRSQYLAWDSSEQKAAGRRVTAAVKAVHAAERTGSPQALRSALGKLMPAAEALGASGGMPHCADPGAKYTDYILKVNNAGYQASTARSRAGLLKAAAQLKGLPVIESQLQAEVSRVLAGA